MKTLEDLYVEQAELKRQIADLEHTRLLESRNLARSVYGVKVVCVECEGTGQIWMGGADIESDPLYGVPCDACHDSQGFVWQVAWVLGTDVAEYKERLKAVL